MNPNVKEEDDNATMADRAGGTDDSSEEGEDDEEEERRIREGFIVDEDEVEVDKEEERWRHRKWHHRRRGKQHNIFRKPQFEHVIEEDDDALIWSFLRRTQVLPSETA